MSTRQADSELKLKKDKLKVISFDQLVLVVSGSLVLLGIILSHFVHPIFIWLSIFVGVGLINVGISDWLDITGYY